MDEVDLLLEELALNSTCQSESSKSDAVNEKASGSVLPGVLSKDISTSSTTYSDPPVPVPTSPGADSPTLELDSILQDLIGLAEGGAGSPVSLTSSKKPDEFTKEEDDEDCSTGKSDVPAFIERQPEDSLDDLLGGLTSDLEKIGVHTNPKGQCAACHKCIVGKMITALGEVWHPEHFVCVMCKTELSNTGFFERDGQPYCSKDYHQLFSPRCAYCKGTILQNILTALDQTWHPDHFFCAHCGEVFGPDGFLEKEGKPYCCRDFYHLFAPKCSGCGEPVRENYLTAVNGTWHPECFVCADCHKPFTDGCFMELDNRPLCSLHFHSRQGTLCSSCSEPIVGRCISALDRRFHPEHFVCAFCLRQLSQGVFKEQKGKPYCTACFRKLFV